MCGLQSMNWEDFQRLAVDLAAAVYGGEGNYHNTCRDGGCDGIVVLKDSTEMAVQASMISDFRKLKRKLKEDLGKKALAGAKRKILVFSLNLTYEQKDQLKHLPGMSKEDVVWGLEDIRAQLKGHPEIRGNYPQLWMPTENNLRRLIAQEVHGGAWKSSKVELDCFIKNEWSGTAKTVCLEKALRFLQERHVVVICGYRGSGRRTLAMQLATALANQGWQFLKISLANEAIEAHEGHAGEGVVYLWENCASNVGTTTGTGRTARANELKKLLSWCKDQDDALLIGTCTCAEWFSLLSLETDRKINENSFDLVRNRSWQDRLTIVRAILFRNNIDIGRAYSAMKDSRLHLALLGEFGCPLEFNPSLFERCIKEEDDSGFCYRFTDNALTQWHDDFKGVISREQQIILQILCCNHYLKESELEHAYQEVKQNLPYGATSPVDFVHELTELTEKGLVQRSRFSGSWYLRGSNFSLAMHTARELIGSPTATLKFIETLKSVISAESALNTLWMYKKIDLSLDESYDLLVSQALKDGVVGLGDKIDFNALLLLWCMPFEEFDTLMRTNKDLMTADGCSPLGEQLRLRQHYDEPRKKEHDVVNALLYFMYRCRTLNYLFSDECKSWFEGMLDLEMTVENFCRMRLYREEPCPRT